MSSSDNTPHLGYAIARWLAEPSVRSASSLPASDLDAAAATIAKAFGASPDNAADKAKYGSGPGLEQVFDIFLKTQKRMGGAAAPAAATPSSSKPSEADAAEAETHKAQGNKLMSSKDYGGAIEAYTKACGLNPTNPVYFSNRSAAYAQIGQHDKAIEDAREAAKVDPKFGKAYSRLGHALFSSGRYAEAVEAYEQGLKVDPTNALMKSGLETAKAHAGGPSSGASNDSVSRGAEPSGAQDPFAGLGGAGGMPDLAGLMNNPMIAQMAQQMMQNGGLEQLMNNPMIRNMMQGMGGAGGGGMPDINAMMQNPQMREMARNLMGGMGGGAGGAGGAGRGSGSGSQGGSSDGPSDMYS